MPNPVPNFVVLYGGRMKRDNKHINADAKDRCIEAVWWGHRLPNAVIIFSVDRKIQNLRDATLDCVTKELRWPTYKMIVPERAHDTLGETKAAINELCRHGVEDVTVVSSWYHLPRICWMWRKLGFKGKIHCVASHTLTEAWFVFPWECAGFTKFFLRTLFHAV
jgi:uncharacterized SAM-binding protein YcdF (DUF218 family)